jgi:hypothetical protein
LSANLNNLRFWQRVSHGAAMFLGFLVWTHTNKRRIGSPSNIQTMKTHSAKFGNIELDYSLIDNIEDYIDVDLYAVLPTEEEYLVRIYKCNGEGDIAAPYYRYAEDRKAPFSDNDVEPPDIVRDAVNSVMPDVTKMILEEEARRFAEAEHEAYWESTVS